jgi:hypothetical protein
MWLAAGSLHKGLRITILSALVEEFPQTFIGVKTHAIPIGDGNEYEIQKLFDSG